MGASPRLHGLPLLVVFLLVASGVGFNFRAVEQSAAPAGTDVGGGLFADAVWTRAGSPYTITSTLVVFPNVTVRIEPGVEVRGGVDGVRGSTIVVRGTLLAEGTPDQPILFARTGVHYDQGPDFDAKGSVKHTRFARSGLAIGNVLTQVSDSVFTGGRSPTTGRRQGLGIVIGVGSRAVIERSLFQDQDTAIWNHGFVSVCKSVFAHNGYTVDGRPDRLQHLLRKRRRPLGGHAKLHCHRRHPWLSGRLALSLDYCHEPGGPGKGFRIERVRPRGAPEFSGSNNDISDNVAYNYYSSDVTTKNLPNNWWGTTDRKLIDKSIYDARDEPVQLGLVNDEPILLHPRLSLLLMHAQGRYRSLLPRS